MENKSSTQEHVLISAEKLQSTEDSERYIDLSNRNQSEEEMAHEDSRNNAQMIEIVTHEECSSITECNLSSEVQMIETLESIHSGTDCEPSKEDKAMCKDTGNVTRNVSDEDGIVKENRFNT